MMPWDNEPDHKEWMAHGLKCVIKRHVDGGGHLCGYEGPPLWWFGFDCAHSGDLCPKYNSEYRLSLGGAYRDMAYVTEQTEHLAKQLAALGGDS